MSDRSIFVSYSRSDWEKYVSPMVDHLRDQGLAVWVDQHLLEGGDDWLDRINDALDKCYCMVLCVSPEALNSRYVKMEYRYFIDEDKPIIPVIVRDAKLPAELRRIQHMPYADQATLIQRLQKLTHAEATGQAQETLELSAPEYFDRARARPKNDLAGKIADYTNAIKLNSEYADAFINRGVAFTVSGKLDTAIDDLNEAIRLNPKSSEAYVQRGNAYKSKRDSERAIADFSEAIRLDPKNINAYIGRGNMYNFERENQKAVKDFQKVLEINPDHHDAKVMRDYVDWWEKHS